MDTRTLALSLTALAVVALATAGPGPTGIDSPARPAPVADSARLADTVPSRPAVAKDSFAPQSGEHLLHEFFGAHWEQRSPTAPAPYSLQFLVALVPDPYDSHLDWLFDGQVEAIRRALETAGYVADRFWFPGERDSTRGTSRRALREQRPGVMLLRHTAAGADTLLLLYLVPELATGGVYKAALQAALRERSALQRGSDLPLRTDPRAPVRIVGPALSGSALSLQLAVRAWAAEHDARGGGRDSFAIVSGSATSFANCRTLNDPRLRMSFQATINSDRALDRLLTEVVLPRLGLARSQVALLRESSTLYGRSLLAGDTARSDSSGSCGRGSNTGETRGQKPPPPGAGSGPETAAAVRSGQPEQTEAPEESKQTEPLEDSLRTEASDEFVVIPFPMSISSLRGAYQRVSAGTPEELALPLPSEAPRLPLDLLDPTRPQEDLPVTSRLSPATLDLILDEVAQTLSRRQIRLVGLLATDVRDKLFLGEEIRRRVRDVQFFTFESNVLYLRSDRSRALRGMLVFSTYPLILENQWMLADRLQTQRFAFGSDAAEGVYNATLLQLGHARAMQDYRSQPRDSTSIRPPIWVTTVGNRTFLPVLRDSQEGEERGYLASACDGDRCEPKPQWPKGLPFLPLAAILASSFALILYAWRSLRSDAELRAELGRLDQSLRPTMETQLLSLRDQVIRGSLMLHDRLYALLRIVALVGIFLAACTPALRRVWLACCSAQEGNKDSGALWLSLHVLEGVYLLLLPLALGAAVIGTVALARGTASVVRLSWHLGAPGWSYFRHGPWTGSGEKWNWRAEVITRTLVVLFGVALLAAYAWFAVEVWSLGRTEFWPFYRRSIELDSLVSPILPLMLGGIGYAIWCSWHIQRIALLRTRTTFESVCDAERGARSAPRSPLGSALRDDLLRTADVAWVIRNRLFQVVPSSGAFGLLVAFACLVPWLWPRFGLSLEALIPIRWGAGHLLAFDVLFRAMVLASMLATAWGAYRLIAVWDGLRQCLAGFSRMPIVTAFDRLPARLARLTRLTLPGFAPVAATGAVADIQWLHLQRLYALKKEEFAAALLPYSPDLLHRLEELMGTPAVQPASLDRSGRRALIDRFLKLHHILRELWRMEPMPEEVTRLLDGLGKELERGDVAPGAASTTLRIRRGFAGPVRLWLRAAEEYAASRMVEYIEWVIRHLRVLAFFMLLSLLLTTLLVSSYPYQPQSLLRLLLLLVLVGSVGALIVVLVQMNRDEVLSRIAHTEPGRVTWNGTFVLNLFTFGVLPLVTLLSSEFPGLRNALFSWVQPLVSALVKQ